MEQHFRETLDNIDSLHRKTNMFVSDRLSMCPEHPNGHELLRGLGIPYLKMDTPGFDWKTMLEEAMSLESYAVPHRSKDSDGWKSLCIHGIDADKTASCKEYGYLDEREAPYQWTWVHEKAPVTFKYLKDLEDAGYFTELYRIRFMYLKPGGYIRFHQDRPDGRNSLGPLNMALNMPKDCHWIFRDWGLVPFQPGDTYAVDISNQHGVWNNSSETRVHIIIHGRYGDAYYEALERSTVQLKDQVADSMRRDLIAENSKCIEIDQLACVIWENNTEISDPDLFSISCDVTEHFVRLRANRHLMVERGVSLRTQLDKALKRGTKWAVVLAPGAVLKDGFFKAAISEINRAHELTFMLGHLLDRKHRWYGVHPQCFIVNLNIWERLGRPEFTALPDADAPVVEPERSSEDIHDDYTPLYLRPSEKRSKVRPCISGWNWIDRALKAGFQVLNLSPGLRAKKLFLYPEQNEVQMLMRLKNPDWSLEKMRELAPLSCHQEQDYEYFQMESSDLEDKVFLFNTESVRSDYVEYNLMPIDMFIGLPAGFMDAHILFRHKFSDGCRLCYYDINRATLEFKKEMLDSWSGQDFPGFIDSAIEKLSETFQNRKLTVDRDQYHSRWANELSLWGEEEKFQSHFSKLKSLPSEFLQMNILEDYDPIIAQLESLKGKHVALWYSNCFNYTPGLAKQGWSMDRCRKQGAAFLNQVYRVALANNLRVTVYGEDVNESAARSGFGVEIRHLFN